MNKYSWKPDDSVDTATVWGRHAQEETTAMGQYVDRWQEAVQSQHPELLRHLVWDRERLNKLEEAINQVIGEEGLDVAAMTLYRRSLLNRLTGLGPLDALLTDDRVTDIMVNGPDQIFCERDGHLDGVKQNFESPGIGRGIALLCGGTGSGLGSPIRLGRRCMDVPGPGPMDWLVAPATMGTLTFCGEQCPLSDPTRRPHPESRLESACPQLSPSGRRLGHRVRSSDRFSGNLRGPHPIYRHGLSGRGLAMSGAHAGICSTSAPLRAAWSPEDGVDPALGPG